MISRRIVSSAVTCPTPGTYLGINYNFKSVRTVNSRYTLNKLNVKMNFLVKTNFLKISLLARLTSVVSFTFLNFVFKNEPFSNDHDEKREELFDDGGRLSDGVVFGAIELLVGPDNESKFVQEVDHEIVGVHQRGSQLQHRHVLVQHLLPAARIVVNTYLYNK